MDDRERETARRWRAANPEKVREQHRRSYLRHQEERRAYGRQYWGERPDKNREQSRRWARANPEKIAAIHQRCLLKRPSLCFDCGKSHPSRTPRCRPCHFKRQRGNNAPHWKGGIYIDKDGYRTIYGRDGRYKPEQRLVWEKANGPLPDGWVVHHTNGNRLDNRLENLAAMTRNEHAKLHHAQTTSSSSAATS